MHAPLGKVTNLSALFKVQRIDFGSGKLTSLQQFSWRFRRLSTFPIRLVVWLLDNRTLQADKEPVQNQVDVTLANMLLF